MANEKEVEELNKLVEQLNERFDRHHKILIKGTQDPFHTDGANAFLVRNHIIHFKSKIQYHCEINKMELPGDYFKELPKEVDRDFMARPNEIFENARKSLAIYEANEDYKFLLKVVPAGVPKDLKEILKNVLGYVWGLKMFIDNQDYVAMRRHEDASRYLSSFKELREKLGDAGVIMNIEKVPKFGEQLTFFEGEYYETKHYH